MESPLGFVPTLFFASLLLFISSPSSTKASTQFVKTVCSQTINNSECLKALESDRRTASTSNYKEIAPIALDLAIVNAKDSYAFINNLIKTNPSEAVKQCADSYKFVVLDFQSARVELDEDALTANYDIKMAVVDNINQCETALKSGVQVPEISSRNSLVYLYSNIGDVITEKLIN